MLTATATAKEKALELYTKFCYHTYAMQDAKDCASLCVDEILNAFCLANEGADILFGVAVKYYNDVKEEINKLQ